jgi:uncharacterized repeat protein (TIGR02543 family)
VLDTSIQKILLKEFCKVKNKFNPKLKNTAKTLFICFFYFINVKTNAQTTRNACTLSEFTSAISASASGDIININCNIALSSSQISLSAKTLTINGNGYELSVPRPGLDDMGKFNSSPSTFRVFNISSSSNVTINNLTIKGGWVDNAGGGAGILSNSSTIRLNNCEVSNCRAGNSSGQQSGPGGAINLDNNSLLYANNTFIRRNAGSYSGGINVTGGSDAYFENSTLSENRSITSNGGGGGASVIGNGSFLFFNNSTLSNNQSTEIGGAINVYQSGTVYFINSSATGNVCFGSTARGGAIGNISSNVYILNSLFAHNYRRSTGTVTAPTGYVLDDIEPWSGPGGIRVYHSIYHANLPSSLGVNTGNIQYTGNANGSNNSIFSGGLLSKITDNDGNEIGDDVYRPFLYNNQGSVAPTLKSSSFVSQSGNRGVQTRFSNNNNSSPAIAYQVGTTWTNLLGTSSSGQLVTTDQVGSNRSTTPARGAIEGEITETLYIVKVNNSTGGNGSINGGTIYGDVYTSGTSLTLTAVPNNGFSFTRWDFVSGGTGTASSSNPYTFTVSQNVTLIPVFTALSAGQFTITYVGNGHTSGTVPTGGTFTSSQTLSNAGTMVRDGYRFTGWNTNANGSGTAYAAGASYSSGTNLTLYAQWQEILWLGGTSTDYNTASNWNTSVVPSNTSFAIAHNASSNLILNSNLQVNFVRFYNTNRHIQLGNFNLQVNELINTNSSRHIKTNGSGQLRMSLANNVATVFPVGNSAYNPVTITNKNTASDVFGVRVLDEVYQNGISGSVLSSIPRIARTWDISKTNANSGGVDFAFTWNAGEAQSLTSGHKLYHYGTSWDLQPNAPTVSGTTLTYNGYSGSFSPFAIGGVTPLPIDLVSFDATPKNNSVDLTWTTFGDNKNPFNILKSTDGITWSPIGTLLPTDNNVHYLFTDHKPAAINYYQLSQIDNSNTLQYSEIRVVSFNGNTLSIFPNPNNGEFTIQSNHLVQFQISDFTGKVIMEGDNNNPLIKTNFAKGIYFIKISDGDKITFNKIIVQ